MPIYLTTISGKKHELKVEPNSTIQWVQEQLEQSIGISAIQQRLLFRGQMLRDDTAVEAARATAGTKLSMVVALESGF
jgi:hypothetical protein